MKYSENFNRDFNYYLKSRNTFTFCGKPQEEIPYDKNGLDAKKAFLKYDAEGKLLPTKHPNILGTLIKTKSSINFQIKEWAQSRATGDLPLIEFSVRKAIEKYPKSNYQSYSTGEDIETKLNLLSWITDAVENQKNHYY